MEASGIRGRGRRRDYRTPSVHREPSGRTQTKAALQHVKLYIDISTKSIWLVIGSSLFWSVNEQCSRHFHFFFFLSLSVKSAGKQLTESERALLAASQDHRQQSVPHGSHYALMDNSVKMAPPRARRGSENAPFLSSTMFSCSSHFFCTLNTPDCH